MSPRSRTAPTLSERITGLAMATDIAEGRLDAAVVQQARQTLDRAGQRRALSADHTVVGFFGATGSGKSSLFNAVVGQELARTAARRPTTSAPLAAVWGDEGSQPLLDWLDVADRHVVGPALSTTSGSGRAAATTTGGLVLLDLPDFDSVTREHRDIVQRMVGLVDVVVWVVDPQKYADAVLHQDFVQPLSRHGAVTMVVLNHADRLAERDVPTVLGSLRELLAQDGLPATGPSAPAAVSARTGEGVGALRTRIHEVAAGRAAAGARLEADVVHAAQDLAHAAGEGDPRGIDKDASERLTAGLARAAGIDMVADAAARSYRLRAGRHTGWIATRWLSRFRKDPLKRLHIESHDRHSDPGVHRTSLPPMNAAQKASADSAVRGFADQVSQGAGEPWHRSVRGAARRHEERLPDALDQAVARTKFSARTSSWWWIVFDILQWLAMAVTVLGLLWLLGLFLADYFQLQLPPPPTVEGFPLPVPTLMVVAGVVLALFLALTGAVLASLASRARASRVRRRLLRSVRETAAEVVEAPVRAELDAHREFRKSLVRATTAV
ncbi:50S ribosome-binding GTPase [Kocuria rhizophila]|uniref:GTPase n=1 Tax=Kocuria TaxID=57493 RepID=UPI00057FB278|nr:MULTISPECIES: GTPase [Kocuria]KIC67285.1 ABC transporter [Kocuria rhizophila]KUP28224.1 ABC transporter [Kocuria rhizophila]MBO4145264.1 50S ribosome-binding GTPase [Kocuria rhizophila]MCT1545653.1 50S ribosome-binding GTPase [Kocuria rhizophila]MDN3226876.1 50S ribosome-binding GTPase [Kocuria rhizophila]